LEDALNVAERAISLQERQLAVRDSTIRAYMHLDTLNMQIKRQWALKEVDYRQQLKKERKRKRAWAYGGLVILIYGLVERFTD